MNIPNINAEELPLPKGHRWVDIANEPWTPEARIWMHWEDRWSVEPLIVGQYHASWSYCIRIEQP